MDGSIGLANPAGSGNMDGTDDGMNKGCRLATAAIAVSFAANMDK